MPTQSPVKLEVDADAVGTPMLTRPGQFLVSSHVAALEVPTEHRAGAAAFRRRSCTAK